jgi:hypothetical protein
VDLEEQLRRQSGADDIRTAVAIEIADRHAITAFAQGAFQPLDGKASIAGVDQQHLRRARVADDDVEIAVAVEVGDGE